MSEVHAADHNHFPLFVALCGNEDAHSSHITYSRDRVTCAKCKRKILKDPFYKAYAADPKPRKK